MRIQYRNIIIGLLLFSGLPAASQTAAEVFGKLAANYAKAMPLQYKSVYVLYKDHDSKTVEESYTGIFNKNAKDELYLKIDQTEIVNSKGFNIKISHGEKEVVLGNPVSNYSGEFDIAQVLEYCTIGTFKDYKAYWEITLLSKKFSSLPYSRIVLNISKDYFLKKQIYYYNTGINFAKDYKKTDVHYPRLEITNTDFNRKPVNESLFKTATYFSRLGKTAALSEKLKKYKMTDKRSIQTNK